MGSESIALDYGTSRTSHRTRDYLPLAAFIFGNVWLLVAVAMFLGRTFARSQPYMVSFTSQGAWLYPGTYNAVNVFCLVVAVACFGFTAALRRAR